MKYLKLFVRNYFLGVGLFLHISLIGQFMEWRTYDLSLTMLHAATMAIGMLMFQYLKDLKAEAGEKEEFNSF